MHIRTLGTGLGWDASRLHNGFGHKTWRPLIEFFSQNFERLRLWHLAWVACFLAFLIFPIVSLVLSVLQHHSVS